MLVVHRIVLMFLSMVDRVKVDGMVDGLRDAQEAKFHRCMCFYRSRKRHRVRRIHPSSPRPMPNVPTFILRLCIDGFSRYPSLESSALLRHHGLFRYNLGWRLRREL